MGGKGVGDVLCAFADPNVLIAADVREDLHATEQGRGAIDKKCRAIEGIRRDAVNPYVGMMALELFNSILKFFQVDITGMFRMTSCARYFKAGVGSSRPNWRWIMCFVERPKTNTSCKALVKRLSLS